MKLIKLITLLIFSSSLFSQGVIPEDLQIPWQNDSTAHILRYDPTYGYYTHFVLDSLNIGDGGEVGQVGFFGTTDTTTDFNTASWKTIPFPTTYHSDGITGGDSIVITQSGKYIIGANVTFSALAGRVYRIKLRILKNGTTPLEVVTLNVNSQIATNYIETFDAAGTAGDYYQLQAIQEADPGTVTLRDQNNGFLIRTTSGGSGPQGPPGVDGVDGTDGADGTDGVSVDSAYVETDSLFVLLSNGDLDGGWYVKGDKGDPGEDGVDGNVLDSNDFYLDTIIQQNDSVYDFEIRNRYGDVLEKTLSLTVSQSESTPQVLSTSSIAGGGRTTLDQGGGSFDIVGGTNSTVSMTGSEYSISSINNFANSLSFNTGTGLLTIGRNGLSSLSTNLDGRYLTSADQFWTESGSLLYPSTIGNDVLIGTSSNVFSSKLRVDGLATVTGSAGALFTLANSTGSAKKWEFGWAVNESYADVIRTGQTWRFGVNSSSDFYFSPTGAAAGADFVITDGGDLVADQYPNVRDDVSTAPINFLFTDAFGTVQSSQPGVFPFINATSSVTVDKYDYIVKSTVSSGTLTITLPATPPTGKSYKIGLSHANSVTTRLTASGTTTIQGLSNFDISTSGSCVGWALVIYKGSGDYEVVTLLIDCDGS